MSEPTFYRYFRNAFGQTPLAFLTEQRVRRARRLLADPHRTVSDVALAVGFSSPSHFIRVFQRHEGQTPKQYQLSRRAAGRA
jgi:AraC-like DNA-binding protein